MCGDVAEQVLHAYGSALCDAAGDDIGLDAVVHRDAVSVGADGEAGTGRDAAEGLAPEAQGLEVEQVVQGEDLACGVASARHGKVLGRHARTVVDDGQVLDSAFRYVDAYLRGSGIDGVVQTLPQHGGRSFDHLSRGYPGSHYRIKLPYRCHRLLRIRTRCRIPSRTESSDIRRPL